MPEGAVAIGAWCDQFGCACGLEARDDILCIVLHLSPISNIECATSTAGLFFSGDSDVHSCLQEQVCRPADSILQIRIVAESASGMKNYVGLFGVDIFQRQSFGPITPVGFRLTERIVFFSHPLDHEHVLGKQFAVFNALDPQLSGDLERFTNLPDQMTGHLAHTTQLAAVDRIEHLVTDLASPEMQRIGHCDPPPSGI